MFPFLFDSWVAQVTINRYPSNTIVPISEVILNSQYWFYSTNFIIPITKTSNIANLYLSCSYMFQVPFFELHFDFSIQCYAFKPIPHSTWAILHNSVLDSNFLRVIFNCLIKFFLNQILIKQLLIRIYRLHWQDSTLNFFTFHLLYY